MIEHRKMLRHFASLVSVLFCVVTVATAQTPQQIAQKAFRSTVLVVMKDANGQPLSLGSGFFVRDDQIATNLHVAEGAARGYAKLVGKETKFNIEGYTAIDEKRDLIILKVASYGVEIVSLGNSDFAQVGETVYAVGNPRGLEGTFSDGIISSIRPVGHDKLIQITAPLSPGSSGGPVLNRKGEVIGVSVLTIRDGQNLNFAIPVNYLKTLLTMVGFAKPLSQVNPTKGQQSLLKDLKRRGVEGVTAGKFHWNDTSFSSINLNYTFSLRNHLRESVRNVHYLVIFYDQLGDPIDVTFAQFPDIIPAGLAKRHRGVASDSSVRQLSTKYEYDKLLNNFWLKETYMEFRILDFEIVKLYCLRFFRPLPKGRLCYNTISLERSYPMAKRRKFTPEFKAEVVLEVLSGATCQAEVCRRHNLNENQLSQWKRQLLENASTLFDSTDKQSSDAEKRIAHLEQLVGRLTVALDIQKKALDWLK